MFQVRVVAVDLTYLSLEDAAAAVEHKITEILLGIWRMRCHVVSVTTIPKTANYSLPDPDSMTRDFHYRENGVLVQVVYTDEPTSRMGQ